MAENTTKPAYNPADRESDAGRTAFLLKTLKMGLFAAAPGLVESYDAKTKRAVIRPALMTQKSSAEAAEQSLIYDVPVRFGGGGGYGVHLPIQKGDTGWMIFCDRDISNFKAARAVMPLNTRRLHAQEDAVFFPDPMQTVEIAGEDLGRAVFQTLNGSNKISMGTQDIRITTQKLEINASQSISFNTPEINISGKLNVGGLITAAAGMVSKSLVSAVDFVAGVLSFISHVHGGVQNGQGNTGGPQ